MEPRDSDGGKGGVPELRAWAEALSREVGRRGGADIVGEVGVMELREAFGRFQVRE